jgi:hypothetical protein
MLKGTTGIVRRVNVDTFYLFGKFLFQGFEGKEVVAEDEMVVEDVFITVSMFGMVTFGGVFQQDSGFQPGAVFFAYPG